MDTFLVLYCLLLVVISIFACPSTCECKSNGFVDCKSRELISIPTPLPRDTAILDLRFNHIRHLSSRDFPFLAQIEVLLISDNRIRSIETVLCVVVS
jgi:hypothetical protein